MNCIKRWNVRKLRIGVLWLFRRFLIVPLLIAIIFILLYFRNENTESELPEIFPKKDPNYLHKETFVHKMDETFIPPMNGDWAEQLKKYGDHDVTSELKEKRDFVRNAMKECWDVYYKYAWGQNEVNPINKVGLSRSEIHFNMKGVTIYDSLDTLLLMGLVDEFKVARNWIQTESKFSNGDRANLFEANIRIVGGLISTYYLTNDQLFITKAKQFVDLTLPSFSSIFPYNHIVLSRLRTRPVQGTANLAEIGSLHLEYAALSHITKNPEYFQKVTDIRNTLTKIFYAKKEPLGSDFSIHGLSEANRKYSLGAGSDSFYEYLIKSHVQNRSDKSSLDFFRDSIKRLEDKIEKKTKDSFVYLGSHSNMELLTCFAGGMYALASLYVDKELSVDYLNKGKEITRTCLTSCFKTSSGLCPENFDPNKLTDKIIDSSPYYLRPEIMESIFYLFRITGDSYYREAGWDLIRSIHKHSHVDSGGYTSVGNVNDPSGSRLGTQESFFMAETLKYAYLLFSDPRFMSLDEWVFNTEAHPFRIMSKS